MKQNFIAQKACLETLNRMGVVLIIGQINPVQGLKEMKMDSTVTGQMCDCAVAGVQFTLICVSLEELRRQTASDASCSPSTSREDLDKAAICRRVPVTPQRKGCNRGLQTA